MRRIEEILANLPELKGRRFYIWGAGNTAMLFREGLARIPWVKIEAYVDNDPSKQGKTIGDVPIIPADKMLTDKKTLVMICTAQPSVFFAITKQLSDIGVESVNIETVIFGLCREDVKRAYDLLEDDESKRVFLGLLESRINCCFPDRDLVSDNKYFCLPDFRMPSVEETLIDCGAYVGDSVESFIWAREGLFRKIIAFEPDKRNLQAMIYRLERLKKEWNIAEDKIQLYPYGVGDEDSVYYMENYAEINGLSSKITATQTEDSEECRIVTLDRFLTGEHFFIKADIESYEYRMLKGAAASIKKFKPRMAICIYHNSVDFFSIALFVKSLVPEYRLSVRHHSSSLSETVLYVSL